MESNKMYKEILLQKNILLDKNNIYDVGFDEDVHTFFT